MILLGINLNHGDSSACIVKDGKILSLIEEERINRIKHWAGVPLASIIECLNNNNLKMTDIDAICLNYNKRSNIFIKLKFIFNNLKKINFFIKYAKNKNNNLSQILKKHFKNNDLPKIVYNNHHKCHISHAFYTSGFDKAIGLSIDGMGDFNSCVISEIGDKKYKVIKETYYPNSLGIFYSAFTQYLNFKNYGDEYKVMGLSAYGQNLIQEVFQFISKNNKYFFKLNMKYFNIENYPMKSKDGTPLYDDLLSETAKLKLDKIKKNYQNNFEADLAYTVQYIYEKYFLDILSYIDNLGKNNLVFAGGCAQNSLANRLIYNFKNIENIYIPPVATDSGTGVGSALNYYANNSQNIQKYEENKNPYLGIKMNEKNTSDFISDLKKNKKYVLTEYSSIETLNKIVSKKIYENNIVGWFQDNAEIGPRALGNRSILANPCNPNIKDLINSKIKRRESFRPFAPSVIEEYVEIYFEKNHLSPYMNIIHKALDNAKKLVPAVVHLDGTSRVHTVNKKLNYKFYNLLSSFMDISGIPMLLNTSFNENEPIVNNYNQAFDCFKRTDMDLLVLDNCIIEKNYSN